MDETLRARTEGDGVAAGALSAEELARWERLARRLLWFAAATMALMVILVVLALVLAPKDDSTLGLMCSLVFRCH